MKINFVDLKRQYSTIKEEIDTAIQDILDNTRFIGGEPVKSFEEEFAGFCNAKHAVGVSSGTSALHLALLAHGIGAGDDVITVPNTFTATCEAIANVGATPVFVDVDEKTRNIDVSKIEDAVSDKTKAILPVHLYGQPSDLDPIYEIAQKQGLVVVEDAAQAHGARYKGKEVGSMNTTCFSFYPGKNLGAYGDAGAVTTQDDEIAEKIRMLSDHGRKDKYAHEQVGYNERLDALQAEILKVKLKHLPDWTDARRANAEEYTRRLSEFGVKTPFEVEYAKHVYHLYVIEVEDRDGLRKHLDGVDVSSGIHYPIPLHLQPAYGFLDYKAGDFPVSEKLSDSILSLPMFPELIGEEIAYVCEKISDYSP